MSKSKRIVEPFVGKWGTFNPGDKCFAVTTCTHTTNVTFVTYVGYVEREGFLFNNETKKYESGPVKFAQVQRPVTKRYCIYADTQERVKWESFDRSRPTEWVREQATRITTLVHNNLIPHNVTAEQLAEKI